MGPIYWCSGIRPGPDRAVGDRPIRHCPQPTVNETIRFVRLGFVGFWVGKGEWPQNLGEQVEQVDGEQVGGEKARQSKACRENGGSETTVGDHNGQRQVDEKAGFGETVWLTSASIRIGRTCRERRKVMADTAAQIYTAVRDLSDRLTQLQRDRLLTVDGGPGRHPRCRV